MSLSEFKKPYNIVTTVLSLLGIVVGIYFYYLGKQYKEISYQIDESASIIYDIKNTSSSFRLTERDSIPITENVYYVRGKVWNSGNLSILPADVRKPLLISISGCKRILDFKIEKQYEDTIQHFELRKVANNKLEVNWNYFDPKNGFSFQVIYLGNDSPNSVLEGKILGVSSMKSVISNNPTPIWYYIFLCIIGFVIGWFGDNLLSLVFRKKTISERVKIILIITLSIGVSLLYNFVYHSLSDNAVPF